MKSKLKIVPVDESNKTPQRVRAEVGPHSDIRVIGSPLGEAPLGVKCEHGVYIPITADSPNHAPFCSLCYPYLLEESEHR